MSVNNERDWMKSHRRVATKLYDFFENKLRSLKEDVPLTYDMPSAVANYLYEEFRKEFDVMHRDIKGNWLFMPDDAFDLNCRGCFNEFGSCGTPCQNCPEAKDFDKNWELEMFFTDKFRIYRRK